jgi:hypothetical protein
LVRNGIHSTYYECISQSHFTKTELEAINGNPLQQYYTSVRGSQANSCRTTSEALVGNSMNNLSPVFGLLLINILESIEITILKLEVIL